MHSSVSPQQSHFAKSTSIWPECLFTGPSGPGVITTDSLIIDIPAKRKKKKQNQDSRKGVCRKQSLNPCQTKLTSSRTQKYLSILKYNLEYKHNCYPKSQKQQKQIFLFLFFLSLFFPLSFFKLGFLRNEECIHERHSQEKRWIPFWVLAQK